MNRRLIPLLVILIAAFYGWREFSDGRWAFGTVPPPTPPPARVATLVVRSNLAASVLVNGQSRGVVTNTSPVQLRLDPGTYTVRLVSQIIDPHEFQVTLHAGERLERQVTLALRTSVNLMDVRVGTADELVQAVARARTGTRITLEAGEYLLTTGLEIRQPLTLIGQGADRTRVVSEAGKFVVRFDAWGVFAAQDIGFEHRGKQPADVMVIEKGTIELARCAFSGGVRNPEKDVYYGDGLWVRGIVLGTVQGSLFSGNGVHGLELQDKARLTLTSNTFERNTQNGLVFFDQSGGEARGNTSRLNGLHGISVNEDALVTVEGNTLEENTEVGLRYSGNAWGTASKNIIRNNKLSGIAVNDTARPTLIGNTSTGNRSYGLYVAATARALVGAGNVFKNNAKAEVQDLRKPATRP